MVVRTRTNPDIANLRVEVAERMTAAQFLAEAPEESKAELIDRVMVIRMAHRGQICMFMMALNSFK